MPANNRRTGTARPRWRHWLSSWLLIPAAVALGVVVFLIVWVQRQAVDADAPTMLPAVEVDLASEGSSLPAPQLPQPQEAPDGESGTGGVFALPDAPAEPPARVADPAPPPPPPPVDATAAEAAASAADSPPVPVHAPPPSYPRRSQQRGERGEVMVQAVVGPDGRPRQVEIARSSSHAALDQAAMRAVRQWRFKPAVRRGEAVAETVHIPITFSP